MQTIKNVLKLLLGITGTVVATLVVMLLTWLYYQPTAHDLPYPGYVDTAMYVWSETRSTNADISSEVTP